MKSFRPRFRKQQVNSKRPDAAFGAQQIKPLVHQYLEEEFGLSDKRPGAVPHRAHCSVGYRGYRTRWIDQREYMRTGSTVACHERYTVCILRIWDT
jgi:hypothetical protein